MAYSTGTGPRRKSSIEAGDFCAGPVRTVSSAVKFSTSGKRAQPKSPQGPLLEPWYLKRSGCCHPAQALLAWSCLISKSKDVNERQRRHYSTTTTSTTLHPSNLPLTTPLPL